MREETQPAVGAATPDQLAPNQGSVLCQSTRTPKRHSQPATELVAEPPARQPPEVCSICMDELDATSFSRVNNCQHRFHFPCIVEWTSRTNRCPLCNASVQVVSEVVSGEVARTKSCKDRVQTVDEYIDDAAVEDVEVVCMECGRDDDEHLLLMCEACDAGCHTYCCDPPLAAVPAEDWFCPTCAASAMQHSSPQVVELDEHPGGNPRRRHRVIADDDDDDDDNIARGENADPPRRIVVDLTVPDGQLDVQCSSEVRRRGRRGPRRLRGRPLSEIISNRIELH